jgi:hypothetical protein
MFAGVNELLPFPTATFVVTVKVVPPPPPPRPRRPSAP